jgi:hypothetical protein
VERDKIIKGFDQLSNLMRSLGENAPWKDYSIGITQEEYDELNDLIVRQKQFNGWFTQENVRIALKALGEQFTESKIHAWLATYSFTATPKRVGVIMAGNIPLVGFHDFACVLLSGHTAVCKLSSDDKTLLPAFSKYLIQFVPELKERIEFSFGKIGIIDAVIATGSDNSTLYFKQYFGKYPHIFRSSRTSVAVLSGEETREEIQNLGKDIFQYFGLGCRNVSHVLLPEGFSLDRIFEGIVDQGELINHNKYANNYDYNRAVFLMNQVPFLDNNVVLFRENKSLFSPLAVVHYQFYTNRKEVDQFLQDNSEQIQAIVGKDFIPFGVAQCPSLDDYADGVDTMRFLNSI